MGFMDKVKQFFGMGGVTVKLECEQQASRQGGMVNGVVHLTSKSDLHILELNVAMKEAFTTGRGDDEETEEFELGKVVLGGNFDIKAGEAKSIPFQLPYQILKSNADELKEKGGALGALGSMAKFANNEKSEFFVEADCDVQGTAFDPGDKQTIHMM